MRIWLDAFRQAWTSPLFLILAGVCAAYILAGYVVAGLYNWPMYVHTQLYSNSFKFGTWWFLLGVVSYRSFYIMIVQRPEHLTLTILRDLRDNCFVPRRIAQGVSVVLLFSILFSVFTGFKSMIPEINPFSFDPLFAQLDKTIHFGVHPWQILFPVTGFALVTTVISFFYKTWFVAKFTVLYWQAFSLRNPQLRAQFFLTYILVWILNGTILATLLSSAGPVFYGAVTGLADDPYAPLIAFLRKSNEISPVWDLFAYDYLWDMYQDQSVQLFSGISAMPSMHVSLAFLFMLLGWRSGRALGIFFTAYLVMIMVGSVHLGWHYAIDGYLGMATTFAVWKIVGWCLVKGRSENAATDHVLEGRSRLPE